jgi:hypothetical protein
VVPGKTPLSDESSDLWGHGTWVDLARQELDLMHALNSPSFWSKKVKIAILALATFIAMC